MWDDVRNHDSTIVVAFIDWWLTASVGSGDCTSAGKDNLVAPPHGQPNRFVASDYLYIPDTRSPIRDCWGSGDSAHRCWEKSGGNCSDPATPNWLVFHNH